MRGLSKSEKSDLSTFYDLSHRFREIYFTDEMRIAKNSDVLNLIKLQQ